MPTLSPVITFQTRIVSEQAVKSEDWQEVYFILPSQLSVSAVCDFPSNYVVDCFNFFTFFCVSRHIIRTDKEDERI